ncbi:zinc finger and BTB domain-containing protein 24-like [Helicoverpa zea]|uniref:zinc finger and BTB domain-containing protein 24-like n=1 Tax=Helicoverpa zea TaxID=7113 RepID=UPI001F5A82E3|nr:zinc finger and BTB domain-containing protein 24-like [Helicoverpa zea]
MFRYPKDLAFQPREAVSKNKEVYGFSCDLCGKGPWCNEIDLEIHRKHSHKGDLIRALKDRNVHMCSICLRVQKDKSTLIQHILVNHLCSAPNATRINRETFICDHCNCIFFNKQLLTLHIYHWHLPKTTKIKQLKIACPKCEKWIRTKSAWFHLLYHGVFSVSTCPICLEIYDNRTELTQHLKTHPGYFNCNICAFETTKECYLNNHVAKHKKSVVYNDGEDVSRFFVPQSLQPSLNNRMHNVFKGIPLANEVRLCVLCRALCFDEDEMRDHILGEHSPEEKEKSKIYQCTCKEVFFNNVLLKHHIFKMKGDHRAWDGVTPLPEEDVENQIVLQVYELDDPSSTVGKIIIQGIPNEEAFSIEDSNSQPEETFASKDLPDINQMET